MIRRVFIVAGGLALLVVSSGIIWPLSMSAATEKSTGTFADTAGARVWWQDEYQALCGFVERSPGHMITTSYTTMSGARDRVRLILIKRDTGGMVLKMRLPGGALFDRDLAAGSAGNAAEIYTITMRDNDLDGMLDDFKIEPPAMPSTGKELNRGDFIRYRHDRDHEFILLQWTMGIGYAVNHFLHGVDSPFPR